MIDWNGMLWKALGQMLLSLPQWFAMTWPLWVLLGLKFGIQWAFRHFEQRRLTTSGIAEIDGMDGRTFEKYLENLFNRLGYRVERTRYVGDYGADLVTRKDGVRTVIQAKRYQGKVGIKAVQEAVASKGYYDCTAAMVVTNSTYTKQAVELARANGVELWDRDRLVEALLSAQPCVGAPVEPIAPVKSPPQAPPPPSAAPAENLSEQLPGAACCAECGAPVSEKVRDFCLAHPERFRGALYCYNHQRASRRSTASMGSPQ
jgi:restriction system protein